MVILIYVVDLRPTCGTCDPISKQKQRNKPQRTKTKPPQQNLNKSSLDKCFAQNCSEELKRQVSPRGVLVRDGQRPSFKTCHVIREEIPQ